MTNETMPSSCAQRVIQPQSGAVIPSSPHRNIAMTSLVIAEHDNASIKGATLNTVTAALACGGDVHVLVAEPAGRKAGIKVADVAALVDKLKNEAKVI